jgi:hypothetical protein
MKREHTYNLMTLSYWPQSHLNPMRSFRFFLLPVPDHGTAVHVVFISMLILFILIVCASIAISNRDIIREIDSIVQVTAWCLLLSSSSCS